MEAPMDDAARAFADKVRELREGSGRTYESLARRVGVGASTLHRYCSGRTVPMDFAPVERLARLCGCRGEELVDLHRLWVLADAERGARQERAAGASADTAAEAHVADGVGSGTGSGGTEVAVEEQGGDGPGTRSAGRPHTVPLTPAPARRRAYVAALTSVVAAIALVLGFGGFTLTSGGKRTATGTDGGGPVPVPSAEHAPPAAPPSSAPTPSRTSPRAPGAAKADGPSSDTASSGLPGSNSPGAAAGAVPFTWVTDDHVWRDGCAHSYLVDRSPAEVAPPPVAADAEQWARSFGAVHGGETRVRITLQGKGSQAVVLESLQVRVAARQSPQGLGTYRMSSGCGGSLTPRLFDVDLDTSRPVARSVAGNDAGEPIPAVSFPYRVSVTDPEVLLVTGRTVACDCDWYLQLRWSSGGRSGTVRIDDGGRPFRTSALGDGPVYDYDYGSRRWVSSLPTARRP
ncbi:helix-turn-helix domain-containing protein [Streptomyces sp. NPDC003023]|uniref:helix-turn-helix domain-containing protein n=1 Tax=Streptomyces sp. NPDC003023 TaxID=3364675 RepID=UPI0036C07A3A